LHQDLALVGESRPGVFNDWIDAPLHPLLGVVDSALEFIGRRPLLGILRLVLFLLDGFALAECVTKVVHFADFLSFAVIGESSPASPGLIRMAYSHVTVIILCLVADSAKILSINEGAKSEKNHAAEPIDALGSDIGRCSDSDSTRY
jgi:hypothetical protein